MFSTNKPVTFEDIVPGCTILFRDGLIATVSHISPLELVQFRDHPWETYGASIHTQQPTPHAFGADFRCTYWSYSQCPCGYLWFRTSETDDNGNVHEQTPRDIVAVNPKFTKSGKVSINV